MKQNLKQTDVVKTDQVFNAVIVVGCIIASAIMIGVYLITR